MSDDKTPDEWAREYVRQIATRVLTHPATEREIRAISELCRGSAKDEQPEWFVEERI